MECSDHYLNFSPKYILACAEDPECIDYIESLSTDIGFWQDYVIKHFCIFPLPQQDPYHVFKGEYYYDLALKQKDADQKMHYILLAKTFESYRAFFDLAKDYIASIEEHLQKQMYNDACKTAIEQVISLTRVAGDIFLSPGYQLQFAVFVNLADLMHRFMGHHHSLIQSYMDRALEALKLMVQNVPYSKLAIRNAKLDLSSNNLKVALDQIDALRPLTEYERESVMGALA